MLSHQKKYHPVYECKLCSKSFRNQKARDNHITNLHEYSDNHLHLPSSSKTIKKYRKRGRPSKKIIKEYKGKITGEKNRGRGQSNKTEIKRGRGRPSKRLREEGVGEIHNAKKAKIENKKRKRVIHAVCDNIKLFTNSHDQSPWGRSQMTRHVLQVNPPQFQKAST